MSQDKVTITVDGKELEAAAGSMLIEVADKVGIHIPRFCYHEKLSVAANCRMCLVEVEKAPKPMPACATPVNEGMVVWTRSEKALTAQKDTMEFLLINHPLDCPICDQGGECELQDQSISHGGSSSNYHEVKRVVVDKDIGELVETEMTRCIQCTRCVRFGEEISGMRELGAFGRGDRMEIGTFVEHSLSSELSGNIIDICPVGALTAKPSRYTARPWEMTQTPGIAPHDSVGSSINLHTFKHRLVRVVAGENEKINECWISNRDRFGYQGVLSEDRASTPMIKQDGVWKNVSWEQALEEVSESLKAIKPEDVGVLASPRATLEELFLLQKTMRSIGVGNIDHRLRQTDFYDQESMGLFPWLGMAIADIEKQQGILIVGSNLRRDQPMINHRIRKAVLNNGASVVCVNPVAFEFNYEVDNQWVTSPEKMVDSLAVIAKSALKLNGVEIPAGLVDLLKSVRINAKSKALAQQLKDADNSVVFLGSIAVQHDRYSTLRALAAVISENTDSTFAYLPEAANTAGAWLAGAVPHREEVGEKSQVTGCDTAKMLNESLKAYVLLDVEADFDLDNPRRSQSVIQKADTVIAITPYASESLLELADIILPSAAFGETSGTYVNAEGQWQSFKAAAKSPGEARPAWKILRVLGNKLGVKGFDYVSSTDVRDELREIYDAACAVTNSFEVSGIYVKSDATDENQIQRIGCVAEYGGDSLQRRATALQKSTPEQNAVHLNETLIKSLGMDSFENSFDVLVEQDGVSTTMSVLKNDTVPDGCALIYSGTDASSQLGSAFGTLKITL